MVLEEKIFFFFWLSWQTQFCMEIKSLNNFERALCQKYPHQILSNLAKWFRKRSHSYEKVYGRTDIIINVKCQHSHEQRPDYGNYLLYFSQ